jgi:hypothetical protein
VAEKLSAKDFYEEACKQDALIVNPIKRKLEAQKATIIDAEAQRLQDLFGFGSTVDNNELELIGIFDYYKKTYPNNRFLSFWGMCRTTEQGEFTFGSSINIYPEQIPKEKQLEILSFKVKIKDIDNPTDVIYRNTPRKYNLVDNSLSPELLFKDFEQQAQNIDLEVYAHEPIVLCSVINGSLSPMMILQKVKNGYLVISKLID